MREVFTDPGVLSEFLYLVAGYRMFASVSATTHNTAEERDLPVWPPDGVGPDDTTALTGVAARSELPDARGVAADDELAVVVGHSGEHLLDSAREFGQLDTGCG